MTSRLRVLLVDDSEDDATLVLRALRRGGYAPAWERVDSTATMEAALAGQRWDVVLCDYRMPKFSIAAAVQALRRHGLDVPVIVVSGDADDEVVAAARAAGVRNVISKGRLAQLAPTIKRRLVPHARQRPRPPR